METPERTLSEEGQARRRFLKQAGTVAWASPMILTMMSRAAHAQPGIGEVCGSRVEDPLAAGTFFCENVTPCGTGAAGGVCTASPNPLDNNCYCTSP